MDKETKIKRKITYEIPGISITIDLDKYHEGDAQDIFKRIRGIFDSKELDLKARQGPAILNLISKEEKNRKRKARLSSESGVPQLEQILDFMLQHPNRRKVWENKELQRIFSKFNTAVICNLLKSKGLLDNIDRGSYRLSEKIIQQVENESTLVQEIRE